MDDGRWTMESNLSRGPSPSAWSIVRRRGSLSVVRRPSSVVCRRSSAVRGLASVVRLYSPNPKSFTDGAVLSQPSISVVLPAFNEEAVIGATVSAVVDFLQTITSDYEVIVVNDGSRDKTKAVVEELSQTNPRVRCVSHERNRGYGAALGTGFAAASRELVFLTDGDKQFDISELVHFLPLIADADLVIGYRDPRRDSPKRLFFGWGWNSLVNVLFGYTARDVDCAFKLFRRSVLDRVRVRATGATFSAELLIKAHRLGYRIVEHRASHYPRPAGQPTGARLDVIARAFRELIWLRLHLDEEISQAPAAEPTTRAEG
jgi:glycosyltransferase involved in cell wall biosynthesis